MFIVSNSYRTYNQVIVCFPQPGLSYCCYKMFVCLRKHFTECILSPVQNSPYALALGQSKLVTKFALFVKKKKKWSVTIKKSINMLMQ